MKSIYRETFWLNFNRFFLILGMVLVFTGWGFSKSGQGWYERDEEVLGTLVSMKLYGREKQCQKTFDQIFERLRMIEKETNLMDPQSELSQLNGKRSMKVGPDLFLMLKTAREYAQKSEGAFDPTVGALTMAYQIKKAPYRYYSLQRLLSGVGYQKMKLDVVMQTVTLEHPETLLDVWGCNKGFAADEALKIIKKNKIKGALVNLGGQITVWGKNVGKRSWQVGIEDPREPRKLLTQIKLQSGQTLSTSSLSQRARHLYRPQDGNIPEQWLQVSVVSHSGIRSDILSTAVFVMGTLDPALLKNSRYWVLSREGRLLRGH